MEKTFDESVRDAWTTLFRPLVKNAVMLVNERFADEPYGDVNKALLSAAGPGMRTEVARFVPSESVSYTRTSPDLEGRVKEEWNRVFNSLIADAVSVIYEQFSYEKPEILDDALLSAVKPSIVTRVVKYMPKTRAVYSTESELLECMNIDSQGFVIDPITQNRIEESNLVSYISNGRKYCFDYETLYRYILGKTNPLNPLTREPLPRQFVDSVIARATASFVSMLGDRLLTYPNFTRYGELIITVHRSTGNILTSLIEYDVLADGVSLYSYPLLEVVSGEHKELTLVPFSDIKERDDKLLFMFRYAKKITDELSQSIKSFLGALLRLVPVYSDKDVVIPTTSTIMDAIVYALREYGFENWNVMDLVLSDGSSLYTLDTNLLVTEALPGETIYTILGRMDRDVSVTVRRKLLDYAVRFDDIGLRNAVLVDTYRLIEGILSGEDVHRDLGDFAPILNPRIVPDGVRREILEKIIRALASGKVERNTENGLWSIIADTASDSIPILMSIPLSEVNIGINWDKYMSARLGLAGTGLIEVAIRYAKNLITGEGNYGEKIYIVVVGILDSPELVHDLLFSGLISLDDIPMIVLYSMDRQRYVIGVPKTSLIQQEFSAPPTVSSNMYPSVSDVIVEPTDDIGDLILKVIQKVGYDDVGDIALMYFSPIMPDKRRSLPPIHNSVMDICNHVVTVVNSRWIGDHEERVWLNQLNGVALERNITPLLSVLGLRSIPSILEQVPLTLTYYECVPIIESLSEPALSKFARDLAEALLLSAAPKTVPLLKLLWDKDAVFGDAIRETINRVPLKSIAIDLDWIWYMVVRRPRDSDLPYPDRDSVRLIVWYLRNTTTPPRNIRDYAIANTMSEDLAQALLDNRYITQEKYSRSIRLIRNGGHYESD